MSYSNSYHFSKDFVWGTATSSFQIEGATHVDGRGISIWDTFCRTPGRVHGGDTGDIACDHYHRYKEDVALIKSLGIKDYRFSIAWPRIIPTGDGAINSKGLDFYDRLVDELLSNGITPWATMFHWDLPQALEDKGGWRTRKTVHAFEKYSKAIVERLADRVQNWYTLNEIFCLTKLSYEMGIHAPGAMEPPAVVNQVVHHALLAHGVGVQAVRQYGKPGSIVGLVANPAPGVPTIERPDYVEAARKHWIRETAQLLAPIYLKGYPGWWLEEQGPNAPLIENGDGELIGTPTDFLGLNIYSGIYVEPADNPLGFQVLTLPHQYPRADIHWLNMIPQGIYWAIRHSVETYNEKLVYITENGACFDDCIDHDGRIVDLDRREYLRNQLLSVQRATTEGLPVKGFFLWSLMDNFEWAEGYSKRFGMVYVNYSTLERIPKFSAHWYSDVIKQNRVV